MRMTREQRSALRAAVTKAPGWKAYRKANDLSSATLTSDQLLALAPQLGVDVAAVVGAAFPAAPTAPVAPATPKEPAPMQPATDAFEGRSAGDVLDAALQPVKGLVGSRVLDMLRDSFGAMADAATAPREAHAPAPAGSALPSGLVKPVQAFGLGKAQQWPEMKQDVLAYNGGVAHGVPARDPHFVWSRDVLGALCAASRLAQNTQTANRSTVLLFGPAGTGKTSAAMQFAAALGRPFVRVAFNRFTEPMELIGQNLPAQSGGVAWHDGAIVKAMQTPGCIILLDEPSFLRPGTNAALLEVLDNRQVFLKEDGNRLVKCARDVQFIVCDNTNLTGDETGRYADTQAQNLALQDRLTWAIAVPFMEASQEARVLEAKTGIASAAAQRMVAFANLTRQGASNGTLTCSAGLRRLIAWADGLAAGMNSTSAFEVSVLTRTDPADRETMVQLAKANIDHVAIANAIKGKPANGTQANAAAQAFGDEPGEDDAQAGE